MTKVNVVGYYKENPKGKEYEKLDERNFYIVVFENSKIDGSKKWLEGYSVTEGHFELRDEGYLDRCEKVTKEQYEKATAGWHTPLEYL